MTLYDNIPSKSHNIKKCFIKKLWHRCFPVNFAKIFKNIFLQNTSERVLLRVLKLLKCLVFLKTTECDNITITFTHQDVRPLEIEDKVNLTLLINK